MPGSTRDHLSEIMVNFNQLSDALKPESGLSGEQHHEIKGDDVAVLSSCRKRAAVGQRSNEIRRKISIEA
jgi:hypothetical protein